ncbi:MAG: hypothetical protein JWQ23_1235, partial [Herminiimonas sp.]|nr:hypothetical protein [Herminiimonas sp.]
MQDQDKVRDRAPQTDQRAQDPADLAASDATESKAAGPDSP